MALVHAGRQALTLRHERGFVFLIHNGKTVCQMPPNVARALAQGLQECAKLEEEWANPAALIRDQAILDRAGVPLRIIHDPGLRHEAFKESQHSTELRRLMPGAPGIPSEEHVGTPTVVRGPAPKKED